MSDTEETRTGTSSALLNIASAYSDSDSSVENYDDLKAPKSLGSLVENLRAEAMRSESEVTKSVEELTQKSSASTTSLSDSEKAVSSVTKIVRLDSGKIVKLCTSTGSKPTEPKVEDINFKISNSSVSDGISRVMDSPLIAGKQTFSKNYEGSSPSGGNASSSSAICDQALSVVEEKSVLVDPSGNPENRIVDINLKEGTSGCVKSQFELMNDLLSEDSNVTKEVLPSTAGSRMSTGKSTFNDLTVDHNIAEGRVLPVAEVCMQELREGTQTDSGILFVLNTENHHNKRAEIQLPEAGPLNVELSNNNNNNNNNNIQDVSRRFSIVPDSFSGQESNVPENERLQKFEEKTESTILNLYLSSKQEKFATMGETPKSNKDSSRDNANESKNNEWNKNPDDKVIRGENILSDVGMLTSGGSAGGSKNKIGADEAAVSKLVRHIEESFDRTPSTLTYKPEIEVKHKELKPLPRLERIKIRTTSSGVNVSKSSGSEDLHASSLSLYRILESSEPLQPPATDFKTRTGSGPVKLKRNFSNILNSNVASLEKKFRPEPSETARLSPTSDESMHKTDSSCMSPSSDASLFLGHSDMSTCRQQQLESIKSPTRVQIPSPSRLPLSPTYQQVSPQQPFQSSFTNLLNTSQNQVPTIQSLRKSPQPVVIPQQPRTARREEQKRTLPLILRKADISNIKGKDVGKIDIGSRLSLKKEENSSKMFNQSDVTIETICLDSSDQSTSLPFNNSSLKQETSGFRPPLDFENVIGTSVVCNDENSGSDNAQPAKENESSQSDIFNVEPVPPPEVPVIVIPKKRGRPRKFPLPEPSGVPPTPSSIVKDTKASKSGKRKKATKKLKAEVEETEDDEASKKRLIPRFKKKKAANDEPEAPRNFNKKGRMEVMTEGCKPVTVQQITEYFWPPISSLPSGEKPDGLMIQEQISEYLGVKSFKRKYPSIKRRPVDMEERNYLQENGYVSENMCDMGLTAVFSADIMEIMYNDFPNKFDEYRKFTREKKMKEQKALREKQAAENMDPRKEALESAVSWNTEFNKTRRFKILHLNENLRRETEGLPVAPFDRILIVHVPDNVPLCVETQCWQSSLFSAECEISTRSAKNKKKDFEDVNKWMLIVGPTE